MDKVEKYITEATSENAVAKMIQKQFDVKVKKVEVKRKIIFALGKHLDENDFEDMDKIDGIHKILKKSFKGSITKHDYDKFIVEEL